MSIHDVYIKTVKVQNYKSLENVSITLFTGLNLIIGDNGAGKSNFLNFLGKVLYDSWQPFFNGWRAYSPIRVDATYSIDIDYKKGPDACHASILYDIATNDNTAFISYKKKVNGKSVETSSGQISDDILIGSAPTIKIQGIFVELFELHKLIQPTFIQFNDPEKMSYITYPGKITLTQKNLVTAEEEAGSYTPRHSILFSTFEKDIEREIKTLNEPSKISTDLIKQKIILWFKRRKKLHDYISLLKKYSPISDIKLNENINIYNTGQKIIIENIVVNFKINNVWVPWSYLSDGSTRLFHIITEVVFGNNNMVLIEEPELGIHPNQLFKLMDFLKLQAIKKQIIISTHSPISLDVLSPDELDQIIIAKMNKEGTSLTHLNSKQIKKAKRYILEVGNLSAYWLHSDLEQ